MQAGPLTEQPHRLSPTLAGAFLGCRASVACPADVVNSRAAVCAAAAVDRISASCWGRLLNSFSTRSAWAPKLSTRSRSRVAAISRNREFAVPLLDAAGVAALLLDGSLDEAGGFVAPLLLPFEVLAIVP